MNWKEELARYEQNKKWDRAIEFMQGVIRENPNDMDAYLLMNYLLMNLLVEEDYDKAKYNNYVTLIKWYFNESYAKFSNNAEYLYLTAKTAVMSEWYFGISVKDYEDMFSKAEKLDPENLLYKESCINFLRKEKPEDPELIAYAKMILSPSSPIRLQLKDKGALGKYILGMKEYWAKGFLERLFKNEQFANFDL